MNPATDPHRISHRDPSGGPLIDPDAVTLRLCAPLAEDGTINGRWCQSNRVAVADVREARITAWQEFDVGWERLHDEGPHEAHHDRMAAFLRDRGVNVIVVDHIGTCLRATLLKLDIAVHPGARGPADSAMVTAAHEQLTR